MCPSENSPSFQPLHNRLFDNEAGSDVTFLVGHEPETWRFPGHRCVLVEANPVFKAMLKNRGEPEQFIPIVDVDGKAFDILLRYLYKEDVNIQSVSTALSTLYAAQKYLCPGLMRICIRFLDQALDISNVLQIFEHIRFYSGQSKQASAPPYELFETEIINDPDDTIRIFHSLLHNCLLFIDVHASEVLLQESLDDLSRDTLADIVDRDSLDAPEILIYAAIERWSSRECKRYQMELSAENLRSVIGDDILFSVRYLLMSKTEFYEGPMNGFLLTKQEITTLYGYLNDIPVSNSTGTITEERLLKLKKQRNPLSKRPLLNNKKSKDVKKKKKKDKDKKCTGACFTDYLVRGLACLFD